MAAEGVHLTNDTRESISSPLGLDAKDMTLQINGAYYDDKNPDIFYIVSFILGQVLSVNRSTGKSTAVLSGLLNPHGFIRTPDGWVVTDTAQGRVIWLNKHKQKVRVLEVVYVPHPSSPEKLLI